MTAPTINPMNDQAFHLRNLKLQSMIEERANDAWKPFMVAFLGSRRGVGATTLLSYVGQELARRHYRVAMTDWAGDFEDLMTIHNTDLPHSEPFNASTEPFNASTEPFNASTWVETGTRLGVLLADVGQARSADLSHLLEARLAEADATADVVLMDMGSGTEIDRIRSCAQCDATVLVSTTDNLSMMDTYASAKLLATVMPSADRNAARTRLHLLMNQVPEASEAEDAGKRFTATCDRFLRLEFASPALMPFCDTNSTGQIQPTSGTTSIIESFADRCVAELEPPATFSQPCAS